MLSVNWRLYWIFEKKKIKSLTTIYEIK